MPDNFFLLLFDTIQRDSVISFPMLGNLTIDPPAYITVFGRNIYLYGIVIGLGFLIAILFCSANAKKFSLKSDNVYDVILFVMPIGILGARAYFVAFQWDYYSLHPNELLAFWNGGLAIYGGIIAGVITLLIVCKVKKIKPFAMLDLIWVLQTPQAIRSLYIRPFSMKVSGICAFSFFCVCCSKRTGENTTVTLPSCISFSTG